jgi:hypothetical protein
MKNRPDSLNGALEEIRELEAQYSETLELAFRLAEAEGGTISLAYAPPTMIMTGCPASDPLCGREPTLAIGISAPTPGTVVHRNEFVLTGEVFAQPGIDILDAEVIVQPGMFSDLRHSNSLFPAPVPPSGTTQFTIAEQGLLFPGYNRVYLSALFSNQISAWSVMTSVFFCAWCRWVTSRFKEE